MYLCNIMQVHHIVEILVAISLYPPSIFHSTRMIFEGKIFPTLVTLERWWEYTQFVNEQATKKHSGYKRLYMAIMLRAIYHRDV